MIKVHPAIYTLLKVVDFEKQIDLSLTTYR